METAAIELRRDSLGRSQAASGVKLFAVAAVLWIASNVFVTGIATIATWEGNASYRRMASLCRLDCNWYASVLELGYFRTPMQSGAANSLFHPLFPLSAYPLHKWLKLSLPGSLVLTSKLELLLAIYSFLLMSHSEMETSTDLFVAGSIVAFNPYIIYAHAGYAEPLYFSLITLGFYFASRAKWISAGTAGGLASATRLTGFLFTASYLIYWLRGENWRIRWRKP